MCLLMKRGVTAGENAGAFIKGVSVGKWQFGMREVMFFLKGKAIFAVNDV